MFSTLLSSRLMSQQKLPGERKRHSFEFQSLALSKVCLEVVVPFQVPIGDIKKHNSNVLFKLGLCRE